MSNYWDATQEQTTANQAAWLQRRSLGIGGSEIGIILGKSPYRTAYSLWLEKTGKKQPENISALPHVQRGIRGEKTCRILLEQKYLTSFNPKEWTKGLVCRCTDDGYSLDKNWILEIKCMGKDAHAAAAQGVVPEHYRLQCQWNLMISGAERCLFVSFRPEDETMHIIDILPDEKEGAQLYQFAELWWSNHITNGIPPALMAGDYVKCELDSFTKAATDYKLALDEFRKAEDLLEQRKAVLSSFTTQDIPALRGAGLMVSRATRQGSVDYKKIPELKGVNLEQYRKDPVQYVVVRSEKEDSGS
jgi:putative phage-type endonuclease